MYHDISLHKPNVSSRHHVELSMSKNQTRNFVRPGARGVVEEPLVSRSAHGDHSNHLHELIDKANVGRAVFKKPFKRIILVGNEAIQACCREVDSFHYLFISAETSMVQNQILPSLSLRSSSID